MNLSDRERERGRLVDRLTAALFRWEIAKLRFPTDGSVTTEDIRAARLACDRAEEDLHAFDYPPAVIS
jgi:hypothetical protein